MIKYHILSPTFFISHFFNLSAQVSFSVFVGFALFDFVFMKSLLLCFLVVVSLIIPPVVSDVTCKNGHNSDVGGAFKSCCHKASHGDHVCLFECDCYRYCYCYCI